MKVVRALSVLLVLCFVCSAGSKLTEIRGRVVDERGNPLVCANVFVKNAKIGCVTDLKGYFSISVPADSGKVTICVSYIGYKDMEIPVDLNAESKKWMEIVLEKNVLTFSPVVVYGDKREMEEKILETSLEKISATEFLSIPTPGASGVLWILQNNPATKSISEFSNDLYVRGGTPDQNLILLNGAPIYFQSHLFGLVPTFAKNSIESVKYYTGCFSVRYGDRLSSVVDIETKPGTEKFGVTGDVNLTGLSITFSGPIRKRIRYRFTGRVFPYDRIIRTMPYSFYDFEGKVSYIMGGKGLLIYNGFRSFDNYHDKDRSTYIIYGYIPHIISADRSSPDSMKCYFVTENNYKWETSFHSIRYIKKHNDFSISDIVLFGSAYSNNIRYLRALFPHANASKVTRDKVRQYNESEKLNPDPPSISNKFTEVGLRAHHTQDISEKMEFSMGLELYHREMDYYWKYINLKFVSRYINIFMDFPPDSMDYWTSLDLFSGYVESVCRISNILWLRSGVRLNKYSPYSRGIINPRINVILNPLGAVKVKLGYGHFSQIISYCTEYGFYNFASLLMPNTIKPSQSTFRTVVIDYSKDRMDFNLTFYSKSFYNLLYVTENHDFRICRATSRGLELSSSLKVSSRFYVKGAYAYSIVQKVRDGIKFYPNYDQRHKLTVTAEFNVGNNWSICGLVKFESGRPANLYKVPAYFPNSISISYYQGNPEYRYIHYGDIVPVFLGLPFNTIRYPDFFRVDLSLNKVIYLRKGLLKFYIHIINLLNRKNVVYYKEIEVYFKYNWSEMQPGGEPLKPQIRYKLIPFNGFPFLPFVGLDFRF